MNTLIKLILVAATASWGFTAVAADKGKAFAGGAVDSGTRVYRRGGFSSMLGMGRTLYGTLPQTVRDQIYAQPITFEGDSAPFIRAVETHDPALGAPVRTVNVSAGFADLMNYVAHVKAIDSQKKGFFQSSIQALAKDHGGQSFAEISGLESASYWSEDVMNVQESNFNQMTSILIAAEISHHYLGHVKKYAAQLRDNKGQPVPMNSLVTTEEWEKSLKAGVLNALDCGYGVEGLIALFEAIDKLPQRPAWAAYIAPANFKFSKVKRELKRYEENYFFGRKQEVAP